MRNSNKTFAMQISPKLLPALRLPAMVLLSALTIFCWTERPAQADPSYVTLQKGQLQPATWYKAPLNIQITDERPRVSDCRRPDEAPQQLNIPIPPMPDAVGGTAGVKMVQRTLEPTGFTSNIPAGGINPKQTLPPVPRGGLSPIDSKRSLSQPRPIHLNNHSAANSTNARKLSDKPAATASYGPSYQAASLPAGLPYSSGQTTRTSVSGTLRKSLIGH